VRTHKAQKLTSYRGKILKPSHFFEITTKGVVTLISMPVLEEVLLETGSCSDELIATFLAIAPNLRHLTCTSSSYSGGNFSSGTTTNRLSYPQLIGFSFGTPSLPVPVEPNPDEHNPIFQDSSLISCAESLEVLSIRLSHMSKVTASYLTKVLASCKSIKVISLESFKAGIPILHGPKVEQLFLRVSFVLCRVLNNLRTVYWQFHS
jgi:hypothetical protein